MRIKITCIMRIFKDRKICFSSLNLNRVDNIKNILEMDHLHELLILFIYELKLKHPVF